MASTLEANIQVHYITFPNGELQIDAYLAIPELAGKLPAIVVVQEIFGVNIHIREVAERLAKAGYIAIAPALFQRIAPRFEVGYSPESAQLGRSYKSQTKADEILSDIQAAIAYLKTLPNVDVESIGSIGFCFGGHVVYLAATLSEIKATALFYGGGIATSAAGGGTGVATIKLTDEIKGEVYAFFGEEDAGIPLDQVDQIESALTYAKIPHRVFRYAGAGHGFFCNHRASYHPQAAADAWPHVLELFQRNLQKKLI